VAQMSRPNLLVSVSIYKQKNREKSRKQQQQQEHHHISYSGIKNCLCFHKMKRKQFFD